MRTMNCQELYEKGWEYGLWDSRMERWDALTVDIKDAYEWSRERIGTVYSLASGDVVNFDDE